MGKMMINQRAEWDGVGCRNLMKFEFAYAENKFNFQNFANHTKEASYVAQPFFSNAQHFSPRECNCRCFFDSWHFVRWMMLWVVASPTIFDHSALWWNNIFPCGAKVQVLRMVGPKGQKQGAVQMFHVPTGTVLFLIKSPMVTGGCRHHWKCQPNTARSPGKLQRSGRTIRNTKFGFGFI
jgi:hypothetical protein